MFINWIGENFFKLNLKEISVGWGLVEEGQGKGIRWSVVQALEPDYFLNPILEDLSMKSETLPKFYSSLAPKLVEYQTLLAKRGWAQGRLVIGCTQIPFVASKLLKAYH